MNDNTNNIKLVQAYCTQCGGQVEVDSSEELAACKYCRTTFFVEKAIQDFNFRNAKVEHVYSVNVKGPIEKVLDFVERQQDRKQQKIDEEKRRLEEEKRRKEELEKKIKDQLFNKRYLKRNLFIIVPIIVITIICFCLNAILSKSWSSEEQIIVEKINLPGSPSDFEGKNFQDVVDKFKNAGFTNVRTEVIDDLILGWFTKDGEVEEVSVDGYTSFSSSISYPKDVPIIVTYHTFPKVELVETVVIDEDNEETIITSNTPVETVKVIIVKTPTVTEKKITIEAPTATKMKATVKAPTATKKIDPEEKYLEINKLILEDLLQAQGWAVGALDKDGKPTQNGVPSPAFAFSLYIENVTFLGDKLRISVFPEFALLSDSDKTFIANTVQNMVEVHTNKITYTTIRLNGDVIGSSKFTNVGEFNWE